MQKEVVNRYYHIAIIHTITERNKMTQAIIIILLLITIVASVMGFRANTDRAMLSCVVISAASYVTALVVYYVG